MEDNNNKESFYSANFQTLPFPPPPPPSRFANMKLPAFWADALVAWFVTVDAQFQLRQITSQSEQFFHVTAAVYKSSLKKVILLVTVPYPVQQYNILKEALLASHMTDFQRVELLMTVEPLGGRKPSELLANMLELCPPTQHNSIFFAVLFLPCLPREIHVLFTHEDHTDLRRLASHTDCLVAFGGGCQNGDVTVTLEDTVESTVVAIRGKNPFQHKQKQQGSRSSHLRYRRDHRAASRTRRSHLPTCRDSPRGCVSTTGYMERKPTPASPPAQGRETAGSRFCILPFSLQQPPSWPLLKSANGQRIPCWGKRRLTVQFGGCRYSWMFILAASTFTS